MQPPAPLSLSHPSHTRSRFQVVAGLTKGILPIINSVGIHGKRFLTGAGRVAQRYEHCVDIAGVTGSIPVAPTIFFNGLAASDAGVGGCK